MIPFRDNIPAERTPVLTMALIALNAAVFLLEATLPLRSREAMIFRFGVIPREFAIIGQGPERVSVVERRPVPTRFGVELAEDVRQYELEGTLAGAVVPLFTSMFLHGGWMHLIGNMWFLWLFGDNVEDRLGRVRYFLLYVLGGLAAGAVQVAVNWNDKTPVIGASGAVAAVLGAYFIQFPHARVLALVPFFNLFWSVVELPAVLFLGLWFVMQFFQGAVALAGVPSGSVAWWAHIGGFVAGLVLMKLLAPEPPGRRGPTWVELNEGDQEPQ